MLQVKDLCKTYQPKKGVPVKALDRVSLTFPEKGMVFLLGKSGSGKSTLLNLLGGLDSYDSGEIIISGTSSKRFRQSDFDSYRNTLVGFIFQDYNVLEEFSVGANIALALELQGRKATDEVLSEILRQVDLEGFGNRRPNELSGGQLQRVAIARALVKDPKIIMADEPTGALDSVTGKQILDTLKKLSAEKLVLVVSHDREFAERYADRIVELSDGKVISDQEYESDSSEEKSGITYEEQQIKIATGYRLTEEDREQINAYLAALEEGKEVSLFSSAKGTRRARPTREIVEQKAQGALQLIASRLPMKVAFRMGSGALKHKKIRLVFTILLSCIAFGLFGLADTFGAYDHISTCVQSILDSAVSYASFERTELQEAEGLEENYYTYGGRIKKEELTQIQEQSGVAVQGVYNPRRSSLDFGFLFDNQAKFTESDFHIYPTRFYGFCEIEEESLKKMDMKLLAGRLPKGDQNEIVISSYICETFYIGGFRAVGEKEENDQGKSDIYDKIAKPEDMLGRIFPLNGKDYTVVGVVESGFDLERYRFLTEKIEDENTADMIINYAMVQELNGIQQYSLAQIAMVGKGHLDEMVAKEPPFRNSEKGYIDLIQKQMINGKEEWYGFGTEYYGTIDETGPYSIVWLDGEKKELQETEIILSLDAILSHIGFYPETPEAMTPEGRVIYSKLSQREKEELLSLVKEMPSFEIQTWSQEMEGGYREIPNTHIVGILVGENEEDADALTSVCLANRELVASVVRLDDGIYSYAVGHMPKDEEGVRKVVEFANSETPIRFELQNPVTFELDGIHEVLTVLSKVFLYVGLGFAIFASLMLANFIGTSVAYKKQEIGILRAIGARSNDVFRIFFSEAFVIAMINFALSALGTFGVVTLVNYVIRTETGILVTLLIFTWRQIALLWGTSLLVAALSSFVPVKKIASKKPIDAIRGR